MGSWSRSDIILSST